MTSLCPVCNTASSKKVEKTPYWICENCSLWYQNPLPPKTYEADHELNEAGESTGHLMSDHDKKVNADLAEALFVNAMKGKAGKTLDIGSKYPYLAHCFATHGNEVFGMDNIDVVPEYAKELNVPMLMADFENTTEEQIQEWTHTGKFDLITMVHVFEHMYNPLNALKKLRHLVAEDGHVFLRLPDHNVSGFERDLTPGHFTIHPYFHALGSIMELMVQAKDLFTVEAYRPMHGAGQSDYLLKPITREPTIVAGMIVKNEERDLPKCLESIKDVVSAVVIIDTGSTDKTEQAVKNWASRTDIPTVYETYLEASEKDETGDWKLWDFAKARNVYVNKIEAMPGVDYVLWMDADDVLTTPRNLQRAKYLSEYDVYGLMIESGGPEWVHHRMWRTGVGIEYDFPIHEYPKLDNKKGLRLNDVKIHHDGAPMPGETSNSRNMRILLREWDKNPNPRTAFYIANTYSDGKHYQEAADWYQKRIGFGDAYIDELMFAHLYRARCLRALDPPQLDAAHATLLEGLARLPNWSELWSELAYIAYDRKKWFEAIGYAMVAISYPSTESQLWRESNKYSDQPMRVISWCYENLGDIPSAKIWAINAKKHIAGEDKDWDNRIARFDQKRIALLRPGAIGDVVMTLQLVKKLKARYPDHNIHYFTNKGIGNELLFLMAKAGVDVMVDYADYNKVAGQYEYTFNLVGYPVESEGYPENPMSKHLLQYFADDMGLSGLSLEECAYTQLDFKAERIIEGKYITFHPKAGWSPYKNWPLERWEEIIAAFPKYKFVQIGAATDPKVPGADHSLMGKPIIHTAVAMTHASLHVGVDSFTNHLTGYNWSGHIIPAVILWGSTQESAAGYPKNTNIALELPCRPCFKEDPAISKMPRGECVTKDANGVHACMNRIGVQDVIGAMRKKLSGSTSGSAGTVIPLRPVACD